MSDFLDDRSANARVLSAAWVDSQKGSRGIRFRFQFDPPDSFPLGDGVEGITHDIWITPGTANMAYKTCKTLGVDTDTVDEQKFKYEINSLFVDARCSLLMGLEAANEYHAEDVWKVKFVNDYMDAPENRPDPLTLLRGRQKQQPKKMKPLAKTPIERAAERPPSAPATVDDDVPF